MRSFDDIIGLEDIQRSKRVIAVAGAEHVDTLRCISRIEREGIARGLLIGEPGAVMAAAEEAGYAPEPSQIIAADDEQQKSSLAVEAVNSGRAHILMKGSVHTSVFSKAFLHHDARLVPPGKLISHVALFDLPFYDRPLFLTDGAVNIAPDIEKKKRILENARSLIRSLGIEHPKTALLAPVETVNPKIRSTVDAAAITELFGPDVFGPIALDAALSEHAAAVKHMSSPVAGHADLLMCPDLDTANAVYKVFTLIPGVRSAGVIAGLSVPVVLTSRSDSDESRFYSVCMAAHSMV